MKSSATSFYRYFPVSRRDKNWGLYVTTAGEARIAPHTMYPPSGHPKGFAFDWQHGRILDGFALVYISSGRGRFESKPNFSARIEPGHAFLLFPGVWHRYAPDPETGWHEHWIGFDGEIARRWLQHRFISTKTSRPENQCRGHRAGHLQPRDAVHSRQPPGAPANPCRRDRQPAGPVLLRATGAAGRRSAKSNAIELAIARIQNEYASDLNMKSLAQELGVSYSWFRSTFTAHTGLSPHQYLLELRHRPRPQPARRNRILRQGNCHADGLRGRTLFLAPLPAEIEFHPQPMAQPQPPAQIRYSISFVLSKNPSPFAILSIVRRASCRILSMLYTALR